MSFADATIARLPGSIRPFAERHHELIKFAIVGATTFVIDSAIFYTLKLTILEPKPVTAKVIAGIVAVIASYILNREWSFRDRGGRERHHEALLFFAFSGVGVLLSMAPLWVSSYVLDLSRRAGSPRFSRTSKRTARSRCWAKGAGAGWISSAIPRTRGCRKPRDTAARGPVPHAECRRTPTDLVTLTQRSACRCAVSDRSAGAGIRRY